ncbi:uncharacterized protein F5891DRAFT_1131100 [Suillus fuscotomentosus]|uniref:CxC2-like cysteine cluster KDZ transposase-associated domain-containing protein n=1 Tax=Suillus fuscotomentosus TaxID=1912939 RepID=A0AAD4HFU0_9AGAM|nr:uncharacterized protein F5891DRAFT_1131100 [Suillus fuscotomentosus]KAG1893939.1 hypothetical protein F5891DRAFT_1131100 [Suillus fuscotomentosus]
MLHLEGRGFEGQRSHCQCGSIDLSFWCKECFGMAMYCKECVIEHHHCLPLHIVEKWNGLFFEHISLKKLGLCVQLGHNPGNHCLNPQPSFSNDFVVIDVNGIHEIKLDFCECKTAQIRYKQLLCARWYPATTTDPQTAATFSVLRLYHLLSFKLKVTTHKFYHSLARCSNSTGLMAIRDRYAPFMCMVHEWRHLRQLQWAGRGHDPSGVIATQAGKLAVICPACPQPGRNLPEGWCNGWCYALFITIDANFCLKRKAVSSDWVDPGSNTGWAYFVDEREYKSYLNDQCSTCVSHNAINMADTKSSHGLAATEVGTMDCAQHDMKRPNGVGDLQKGENNVIVPVLNVSYDIACQWSKKFWAQMETMPTHLHLPHETLNIHYFVPKFHIGAHIEECQITFSWNFGKFVGHTDGEAPELASSTKEMGPGTQHDTLDDYFGDWNWKKIASLGWTLKRKMVDALKWKTEHCHALDKLESTIHPVLIAAWRGEVEAWEEDSANVNPFQSRVVSITLAAMHSQLADSEASELQAGINLSLHCDISLSVLISTGIDLEEQQYQKETLMHHTNTLQCKIDTWACIQELYIPTVPALHSSGPNSALPTSLKPQDFPLYLPSALNDIECDQWLHENEWELCYAQALDALNEVRSHLRQAASTRVEARKDASVNKYRCARAALVALSRKLEKVSWEAIICPLETGDIRPMGDFSCGHSQGTADNSCTKDDRVQDCVHIEWCKARAHAAHWSEEVDLLLEEMQRVLAYLEWEIGACSSHVTMRQLNKVPEQEGLEAYAFRQVGLHADMRRSFQGIWHNVPVLVESTIDVVDEISVSAEETDRVPSLHAPPSVHNC